MTPPITAQLGHHTDYTPGSWIPAAPPMDDLDIQHAYSLIEAQRRRIAELEDMATKDELTGLSNRRGLLDVIARENDRVARGQSTGAVLVMIDLNDFKSINDTFGHDAGDAALKAVSNTLLGFIRTTDYAARVGGDEFLLLLAHTTPSQVSRRLQMLEEFLGELSVKWNKRPVTISAAIGAASLDGKTKPVTLINKADKAMYDAKAALKKKLRSQAASSSTSRSERIMA